VAYVITQNCCKDASCVAACPVDCIRPVHRSGGADTAEMLYIDPESCIDCGACFDECPVDAIYYEEDLPPHLARFKELNAEYFERNPLRAENSPEVARRMPVPAGSLRVAVVGSGPAACYAAAELIATDGVEVDLFERLPTPFGLIRAGVAPDHQRTKSVVRMFNATFGRQQLRCHFNVEVGRDISHDELVAAHHAVIYAVGASDSRALGLPQEALPGSYPAADFVGWYNGHPDHTAHDFDLTGGRAVIVGNGNVALDVARVLLMDQTALTNTDIAEHALKALRDSGIEEVVILGRRGLANAAFSVSEFLALGHLPGVDVVIEGDAMEDSAASDFESSYKIAVAREYAGRARTPGHKRIIFRFGATPLEVTGSERVTALRLEDGDVLETSLLLRSIGYRGKPIAGLPFDAERGIVPNKAGRVHDDAQSPVPGVYVAGWIKRGPRGVIGSNRTCAAETVAALWEDFNAGKLKQEVPQRDALLDLLMERGVDRLSWAGWQSIDATELERGQAAGRPRSKLVSLHEMVAAAQSCE